MKKLLLFTALFLTMSAATLWSQEDGLLSEECAQCMHESNGVTAAMIECLQTEHEKQDARLNAVYKELMEKTGGKQAEKLRAAQRAWIQFRDAYGDYLNDPDGGSLARVNAVFWHTEATAEQARRLEGQLDF